MRFRIINVGHEPALFFIYGQITPDSTEENVYSEVHARNACLEARTHLQTFKWVVIPGSPVINDIPGLMNNSDLRDPRIGTAVYGCILYKSTGDDNKVRETPFVGRISMLNTDGKPPNDEKPIIVDFSHGPVAPDKLCIINVLEIGSAN